MGKKTTILLASWIGLFVLIATIEAQDEQWLQYHSAREAHRIMPEMGSSRQEATTKKPQGVNLPTFKTQTPMFVRWLTPMVEDGGLWIALDRTHKPGKLDRLYIDSNSNGHLDDEEAVEAYRTDRHYTFFGPVKVVFDTEEGPVTYHLNFRYFDYNERNQRLYIYSGGWYEGEGCDYRECLHCWDPASECHNDADAVGYYESWCEDGEADCDLNHSLDWSCHYDTVMVRGCSC